MFSLKHRLINQIVKFQLSHSLTTSSSNPGHKMRKHLPTRPSVLFRVTPPSTNRAKCCLTSVIKCETVCPTWRAAVIFGGIIKCETSEVSLSRVWVWVFSAWCYECKICKCLLDLELLDPSDPSESPVIIDASGVSMEVEIGLLNNWDGNNMVW
jgi:hypothetical protein